MSSRSAYGMLGLIMMSNAVPEVASTATSADAVVPVVARPAGSKDEDAPKESSRSSRAGAILESVAPVDHGDLRLRILSAEYRPSGGGEGARPLLFVELSVMNTNPVRKYDDFQFFASSTKLVDEFGNRYRRIHTVKSPIELVRNPLYPGETIVIPLVFEPNVPLARSLQLSLEAPEAGLASKRLEFGIPTASIGPLKTASSVSARASTDASQLSRRESAVLSASR
ncbi:MAG: hypothetical protein SFX72_15025 [Isosphaeraceae bacterium]|nr:hypothetical protein [Isosphaeraceae bacterium]